MDADASAREALLILGLVPGLGPTLTRRCIAQLGSAQAVIEASTGTLGQIRGIGQQRADQMRVALDELANGRALAREKELMARSQVQLVIEADPQYPPLLKHIPDPPPLLYVRGRLKPDDALSVAIVGSRQCTQYGREQADRFAAMCASAGLCIVSGGAAGIDAAAHRAAVRIGGRTVAVLGSGLARPYPIQHEPLFDQIAAEGGAVVSELPMSIGPMKENFPRRNRIISGMALGTLVVEAALRSGALITARLASEDHGREVMAVPGRVDSIASAGCHKIIREGWATLVTNAADVMDSLGEAGQMLRSAMAHDPQATQEPPPGELFAQATMTPSQRKVFECLSEPRSLDELVALTQLAVGPLQADLTMLELRSLVQRKNGMFSKRR